MKVNLSKNIGTSIWSEWPSCIFYFGSTGFLAILAYLYNINLMLIADLIRFTLIPFILFLIYRVYHKQKLLANLKKACTQGQVLTINDPHGLIEKTFSNAFNQVQQQRLQVENGVQEQFKQHRDYLIMWSHEVKTPLTALSLLAENENEVASIDVQQ